MSKIQDLTRSGYSELIDAAKKDKKNPEGVSKDFGQTISEFVKGVNSLQKDAGQEIREVIEGRSENLHQAMAKMEEAKISFQLMLEIRNKLMESYKELQRIQV